MRFGEWMRERREERGLSTRELSALLGYSSAVISKVERGASDMPREALGRALRVLRVPVSRWWEALDLPRGGGDE